MPLQKFRSFDIAEDAKGASLELWRGQREVVCLASDPARIQFVELHVLSAPGTVAGFETAEDVFREQAQGLMRVCHPNVIEVREYGEDDGTLFFITEFVDGESLDSYLARCNPLPAWLALEIARQLTAGLLAVRGENVLARADLFNARLVLEGETTSDLVVKLCEFGLANAAPDAAEASVHERRCVRDVGRLVLYALSGLISDKLTAKTLASLPVPAELGQLLTRLLESGSRQTITDLESLAAAIAACGKNTTLSARPERLPVTLRPRLPLHSHFSSLAQLGEKLGGYRLERTAFDALQPYAQRAFGPAGMPVTVQLLPPPRLAAPAHLVLLKRAFTRMKGEEHPHLLRLLDLPAGDAPEFFIEEAAPRHTLDAVRRLRKSLAPAEVAHLLQLTEKAVAQAEKLGLPAVILAPQQLYLEFAGKDDPRKQPTDEELARLPVPDWPNFRLRLRTYPAMVNMAQPHRFRIEKLLGTGSRASRDAGLAGLRAPEAADYAALALSLFGGEATVPGPPLLLIQQGLAGIGEPQRRKYLDQLCEVLVPRPSKSRASAAAPKGAGRAGSRPAVAEAAAEAASSRTPAGEKGEKKPAAVGGTRPAPALKPISSRRAARPTADVGHARDPADKQAVAAVTRTEVAADFTALARSESEILEVEQPSGGFAEVLFGAPAGEETAAEADEIGAIIRPQAPQVLFPESTDDDDRIDELASSPLRFHYEDSRRSHFGVGRLVVLIVLAALVIALIMAHFTGLAPWAAGR